MDTFTIIPPLTGMSALNAASDLLESHGIETVVDYSGTRALKDPQLLVPTHQLHRSMQILRHNCYLRDEAWESNLAA